MLQKHQHKHSNQSQWDEEKGAVGKFLLTSAEVLTNTIMYVQ